MEVERDQTRYCYCGVLAKQFVSWTDEDPGRRFWSCNKYKPEGNEHCNLFMWIDPPWCPRASSVIKGLQRNRNILQNQLRSLRDSKARMQVELDVMRAKEMILDEEVNESRAKENKGWIVGIVYWIYLLAAKFAMQKMIEGNDELEASYEYLQNEDDEPGQIITKMSIDTIFITSKVFSNITFPVFGNASQQRFNIFLH
ncbi:hypothetical protein M0R45_025828 [Rubus argutus]|uniref:GRF-type domain-containing protein n=1 Tax=Rubus argutus TaxID=59490 RepID=A0AAW1WXC7_RUBAR